MPTYFWNTTTNSWSEYIFTSVSSGNNVYVRPTGSGSMSSANRVAEIYAHNGTGWSRVFKGLPNPPVAPSTPTISTASTWKDRINQTAVQWSAVAIPADADSMVYKLEVCDANKNLLYTNTYASNVTSATLSIPIYGITQYYRVYAVATNRGGSTNGGYSAFLGIRSGTTTTWGSYDSRSTSDGVLYRVYNTGYSTQTDQYIPGATVTTSIQIKTWQNVAGFYSVIEVAGSGGLTIELDGSVVARIFDTTFSIYEVGQTSWVVKPISGCTGGKVTMYLRWSGIKTVANTLV